ncbi:MAG: hypothetical protein R3C61_24270 [Bacteroidia bacterium]
MDAFQFASKDTNSGRNFLKDMKEFTKWYGVRPQLHEYLKEMNEEVVSKYNNCS